MQQGVNKNCTLTKGVALDREAAAQQDVVVLPNVQESYFNITHQTLEMCRMAAMDPSVTHLLKVDDDSYVHVAKLMSRLKALPREKMFAGYIEKAGKCCVPDGVMLDVLFDIVKADCTVAQSWSCRSRCMLLC